ncbi:hypothetical protein FRB98_004569 [Tulasnella sp. 332]|nr:hypothetical protein FRB98_004569 [Tulasnella sp. 332]
MSRSSGRSNAENNGSPMPIGFQKLATLAKRVLKTSDDRPSFEDLWTEEPSFDFSCQTSNEIRREFKKITPRSHATAAASFTHASNTASPITPTHLFSPHFNVFGTFSASSSPSPGTSSSSYQSKTASSPSQSVHAFFAAPSTLLESSGITQPDASLHEHCEIIRVVENDEMESGQTISRRLSVILYPDAERNPPVVLSPENLQDESGEAHQTGNDAYEGIDVFGMNYVGSIYFERGLMGLTTARF